MTVLNPTVIDQIARDLYVTVIEREYGDAGVSVLKDIMALLRHLFRYVEPEDLSSPLVLCKSFDGDEPLLREPPSLTLLSLDAVATEISGSCIIQVRAQGDILLWRNVTPDVDSLSQVAIVYLYRSRQEFFVIKGSHKQIPNPSPSHASIFSIPTFRVLREALLDYRSRMIRTSRCKLFASVWHDTRRILLVNKPEAVMRDSLTQFLTSVLGGDVEVRPEQNVDESHPVDVKVTWLFTNRHAVIEIKWLGKSLTLTGSTTDYADARAREGASQLADYLDRDKGEAPQKRQRGYLVVIDARRRKITSESTTLSTTDGMYYERQEIRFDPEYHLQRVDFEEPIRMFAEPICQ